MLKWPRLELVTVYIVGAPATGKTTLAMRLVRSWKRLKRNYKPVAIFARLVDKDVVDEVVEFARKVVEATESKAVALVFDDASFVLGRDSASRRVVSKILRVRHEVPAKWFLVVLISHWFRSVPPALRTANVKILTSIDVTWIESLREAFPLGALWDFYEAWSKWQKPGLALVHVMGQEPLIMKWRRPDKDLEPPWIDFNMQMKMKQGEEQEVTGE